MVSGGRRTARLDYQEVLTSTDGFTWTSTQAGWRQRAFHAMASHLGDLFVMGGEVQDLGLGGDVYVYNPQYGWGQERAGAVPPFAEASAISYQNHLWLIGGRTVAGPVNTVYMRASNGDWLPRAAAPWAPRRRPAVFTFGDALFVGLGLDGAGQPLDDMWLTEDGQTWRPADGPVRPAGLRSQPAWGPFGDGLLVLGGSTLPPPSPSPVYLYRPFAG
ncbi:hypothetical protein [Phenylobacterium sp. J367]|uniref:hypothetical protein n=1 Tax=Phenylobacterium sp. J367 TaxID=2898435 RepID=UPI002151911A|nr:hypothetical protein [Phenylobacterium sp. J367]MCR5879188.1 hypothetical protein [Phenylobacterium sp. J367]